MLHSSKLWWLWKKPVVGWHWWLWEEPVVMCGKWHVRQATLQQMFKVTTLCTDTCFQSFSPLIHYIVHHAVLKFSHVATRSFRNSSISRIDGSYTRGCILYRLWDIAFDKSKIALFGTPLAFNARKKGLPWDNLSKMLHGGQRMVSVHSGEEIFPNSSSHWVGCTNVKDDRRQTDRQTDLR